MYFASIYRVLSDHEEKEIKKENGLLKRSLAEDWIRRESCILLLPIFS